MPHMFSENAPVLPHSSAPTSGEPQRGDCINLSTSRMSSQDSSRGPGAPTTHPGVSSRQGGSAPDRSLPSEASGSQIEAPARTRNEDMNQIADQTFLEEVVPGKGPMTGMVSIAIFGEDFPEIPLYVWFGENCVRAVSHARVYYPPWINIDPEISNRSGAMLVLCDAFSLHPHAQVS